jgi:hypothetical protein
LTHDSGMAYSIGNWMRIQGLVEGAAVPIISFSVQLRAIARESQPTYDVFMHSGGVIFRMTALGLLLPVLKDDWSYPRRTWLVRSHFPTSFRQ